MVIRMNSTLFLLVCIATQTLRVLGSVIILKNNEIGAWSTEKRTLLCVSEDDGGALVWNNNLDWRYRTYAFTDKERNTRFYSKTEGKVSKIACNFNVNEECVSSWNRSNWTLTSSLIKPMGPVFDVRWEDFKEINNFNNYNEYQPVEEMPRSGTIVFSTRASTDAHVLLCNTENYNEDFCYWIIIGGWYNQRSVIRKCAFGVPPPPEYPMSESECSESKVTTFHNPLSVTEWRTFILTWNNGTRNISLYDETSMIMTYVDDSPNKKPNENYHLFFRSYVNALFKLHKYHFLYTADVDATLVSPDFYFNDILCVEMFIGLCAECEIDITLTSTSDDFIEQKLYTAKGSTVAAIYRLPMWQVVKINKTISSGSNVATRLKFVKRLKKNTTDPHWAVANIRECPQAGAVRFGSMVPTQDYADGQYYWPNVTCQKIFYPESSVVSSIPAPALNVELDGINCPIGMVGPHCSIDCHSHFPNSYVCRNIIICGEPGCTCPAGFIGRNCNTNCAYNKYGHDCKDTCGDCSQNYCQFVTGACPYGCDNSIKYHIPPLCKIGIDPPPIPGIDSINETSVHVFLEAKDIYKLTNSSYVFSIWKDKSVQPHIRDKYAYIFKNTTQLEKTVSDLEPGTLYWVMCTLFFEDNRIPVSSKWGHFMTRCNVAFCYARCNSSHANDSQKQWFVHRYKLTELDVLANSEFEVEPSETSITLKQRSGSVGLYSCPANWYDVLVQEVQSGTQISKGSVTSFPHVFPDLTPYTPYKIVVSGEDKAYFSQEVLTLEGAPSPVRNLQATSLSDNSVILSWDSPKYWNGAFTKYEVILSIQTYLGCHDMKRISPRSNNMTTHTTSSSVTFTTLQFYTKYIATVYAHNSKRGSPTRTAFTTRVSETPTATLSNLTLHNNTVYWGPPKDCTTISGPIPVTKIIITGLSEAVNDFYEERQTQSNYFLLSNTKRTMYGAEKYKVQIYAMRSYNKRHNSSACQKLEFTTPPREPPAVVNLEIVEVDSRLKTTTLRWQRPRPPTNGEIEYYSIAYCNSLCQFLPHKISADQCCELWNDYVCATIEQPYRTFSKIAVYAHNKDVVGNGTQAHTRDIRTEQEPRAPEKFTFESLSNAILDLTWSHPWKTGGRLDIFRVEANVESTKLRKQLQQSTKGMIHDHRVLNYKEEYKERLYLLPSTSYKISIRAVTTGGVFGVTKYIAVQTPNSMGFDTELETKVRSTDSTIVLHVPNVSNDTDGSMMYVVVKGSHRCEHHLKLNYLLETQAGVKYYETAWLAAQFPTNKYAGKTFVVGDNRIYGGATNCPLLPQESYEIIIVVRTESESIHEQVIVAKTSSILMAKVPQRHDEAWLVPIIIFIVAAAAAFYYYRRRKRGALKETSCQDEMPLPHTIDTCDTKTSLPDIRKSRQSLEMIASSDKESLSEQNALNCQPVGFEPDPIGGRTSLVKVKDFEDYVRQAITSGLLDSQYETFPRGQTKAWDYGKLPQNKLKNRYGNLIAYDETRVILKKLPDDPYSDYINANYIKGYKKEKVYIATQGPKSNTVIDFWRMIWQEEVLVICMLANLTESGKTKCEQYWPDIGKKKKYGDVIVLNAKHNVFADYTFRTLHVTCGEVTRKIEHLHYTAWPDHGVPLYTHSVVTYLKKLLATSAGNGPIVVHCSAGVGRTGTIILCDICLRRAAAEGVVDVFAEAESIRSQRANMVDNKQQYLLAHLVLVECLLSFPTALLCNDALPAKIKELKKQLPVQRQRLQDTAWQDEALRPQCIITALSARNLAKNRYPDLVSEKTPFNRVYLKRYPPSDEDSDYISAVYVDGVKFQNQYLATQLPLPSTFNDFWRMIAEFKVELVIMLQPPDPEDPTCCPVVPKGGEFKPTPYINVISNDVITLEYYSSQKLTLIDNSEKPAREQPVTILCSTEWKPGRHQDPPPVIALVTLWQAAERISRGDGPTVTLCHDGVSGCGLYLALSFLLERMAVERECDVCLAVRAVRRSRPDFVQSLENMEYLYEAAITYLEYFETYANFT